MKDFFVYYKGRGYGCDYTIGCNLCVEKRAADSIEEVIEEITEEIEESPDYSEERIESITIIEVAQERKLDIESITSNIRQQQLAQEKAEEEARERAELERLKKKYE